jgi:hypothetical protein
MKKRNIPAILLIIFPWLLILPFLGQLVFTHGIVMSMFQYIYNPVLVLFPLVLILNLGRALFSRLDAETLSLWNLRIKLWLIPVYLFILVFAIGVPVAIPLFFIFDALLLAVSSCYGLRSLVRLKKDGQLENGTFVLLFACHFIFILDAVAAILLRKKTKNM